MEKGVTFCILLHGDKLAYLGEIIESSGGPRHLSAIPLKAFYLFKMTKSIINFGLKKISN